MSVKHPVSFVVNKLIRLTSMNDIYVENKKIEELRGISVNLT